MPQTASRLKSVLRPSASLHAVPFCPPMSLATMLALGFGLSVDTFAVALGLSAGMRGPFFRQTMRLAWACGFFEGLTPVIGWAAGAGARGLVHSCSPWIAAGLLSAVGIESLWAAFRKGGDLREASGFDPTTGRQLLMVSVGTSMDGLAAGLWLALIRAPIVCPSIVAGLVTVLMTSIAMAAGGKLGARIAKRMEVLGGAVLIAVAVKVLVTSL